MGAANQRKTLSLLPYLAGNHGLTLKLDWPPIPASNEYAFLLDQSHYTPDPSHATDPLVKLIEGEIVAHNGDRPLQRLFLVMSKDSYPPSTVHPKLTTNSLIDEIWQRSYIFFQSRPSPLGPFLFYSPQEMGERIPRFGSLFLCQKTGHYFHPPCSTCGMPLELMEDDILLEKIGLPPYTTSLMRFLYCPHCFDRGNRVCYCPRPPKELAMVQDVELNGLPQLLLSWSSLVKEMAMASGLPCLECSHKAPCFGLEQEVLTMVLPLAFYPSYLFAFKAPDMDARSYLDAVSGRTKGGSNDEYSSSYLFFPRTDPRSFYEILFLKLSFLCQVFHDVIEGLDHRYLNASLLLERLWVHFPRLSTLIPQLWCFKPVIVGLIDDIRHYVKPHPFSSHLLLDFAVLWFQVLCTNSRLTVRELNQWIEGVISRIERGDLQDIPSHDGQDMVQGPPGPEEIYWEPPGFEMDRAAVGLWSKIMGYGIRLLEKAVGPVHTRDLQGLLHEAHSLANEAKQHILGEGLSITSLEVPRHDEADIHIGAILDDLETKWHIKDIERTGPQGAADHQAGSEMTLPHWDRAASSRPDSGTMDISELQTLPLDKAEDEELPETIVLSGPKTEAPKEPTTQRKTWQEEIPDSEPGQLESDDEFLEETVILRPKGNAE